ncbi:DoxX family protein [Sphingobacterium corticibacterium]|uniref:DoxX family protein n=1 Tax=Sphingobacterium corticibacterium TaxID=2484746 RepID=A0A4Q6Y0A2_9SPHI|nr:DoxX family protein [Sphingobacterium corticibacterium]RZF62629.1 DoxX family protein [Sphingobacterium corticibacterium]
MKKFFLTVQKGTTSSNLAALILRIGFGILMIPHHGYVKLVEFNERKDGFFDLLGVGSTVSLSLAIFAEFFCSILLILGLFTRLATIPLLITMLVIFSVHNWELFGKYELGTAFFLAYLSILALGPGKFSMDYLLFKRRR